MTPPGAAGAVRSCGPGGRAGAPSYGAPRSTHYRPRRRALAGGAVPSLRRDALPPRCTSQGALPPARAILIAAARSRGSADVSVAPSWKSRPLMDGMTRAAPTCKARSKRSGARCRRAPMRGQAVCAIHGGKSPSGAANPAFKHGRRSKFLPPEIRAHYEAALADTELLALRDELALLDARLNQVLGQLETGDATAWRAELVQQMAALEETLRTANYTELPHAVRALRAVVKAGAEAGTIWAEARTLIQERRKVAETERRRQEAMQQTMTAREAMVLARALADAVQRHVPDRRVLAAINADLSAVLAVPLRPAAAPVAAAS